MFAQKESTFRYGLPVHRDAARAIDAPTYTDAGRVVGVRDAAGS